MRIMVLLLLTLALPAVSWARPALPASIPAPSAQCRAAILAAERSAHLPDRLLDSIAVVESGRRDPVSGVVYPWPWAINAEGIGHWYETKVEAIAAVLALQARGVRSIDVGCLQVNLMYHPGAFASLDAAFDPVLNAAYGAHFLQVLFDQTAAWPKAAAAYHSQTPELGADYARKVLAAWGVPLPPVGSQAIRTGASGMGNETAPAYLPLTASAPTNRVAVMLPTGTDAIRVLPLSGGSQSGGGQFGGGQSGSGRGLDAYRLAPISMAMRMPRGS